MTKNEWTQNSSFFVEMSACRICGNGSHDNQVCPELVIPLRDGFYRPQGGGGHSHEEDDDAIKKLLPSLRLAPTDLPVHSPVIAHPFSQYAPTHDESLYLYSPCATIPA